MPEISRPLPPPPTVLAALPSQAGRALRQGLPRCERFNDLPDLPAPVDWQCEVAYRDRTDLKVVVTRNKPPPGGLCEHDCGDGDRGASSVRGRWIRVGETPVQLTFSPDEDQPGSGFANATATLGLVLVDVQGQDQPDDRAVEALARQLNYSALR